MIGDRLRYLARVRARLARQTQGIGACPVPIGLVARTLEGRLGRLFELEAPLFDGRSAGSFDELFQFFANLHGDVPFLGRFPVHAILAPPGPAERGK